MDTIIKSMLVRFLGGLLPGLLASVFTVAITHGILTPEQAGVLTAILVSALAAGVMWAYKWLTAKAMQVVGLHLGAAHDLNATPVAVSAATADVVAAEPLAGKIRIINEGLEAGAALTHGKANRAIAAAGAVLNILRERK